MPGKIVTEGCRVVRVRQQRLGHHQGVLRVVTDHAASQDERVLEGRLPKDPGGTASRQPLAWKPDRISDGRAEE